MTKNVYFHDNVMFILKRSPRLAGSVLVYSFSLRSVANYRIVMLLGHKQKHSAKIMGEIYYVTISATPALTL